ncbi:MAG: hypothetical protein IK087_06495, partial [Lachnospiraceae bacterium]|nr:hypothetical protein [Lachnospiraceae bacterium]
SRHHSRCVLQQNSDDQHPDCQMIFPNLHAPSPFDSASFPLCLMIQFRKVLKRLCQSLYTDSRIHPNFTHKKDS